MNNRTYNVPRNFHFEFSAWSQIIFSHLEFRPRKSIYWGLFVYLFLLLELMCSELIPHLCVQSLYFTKILCLYFSWKQIQVIPFFVKDLFIGSQWWIQVEGEVSCVVKSKKKYVQVFNPIRPSRGDSVIGHLRIM